MSAVISQHPSLLSQLKHITVVVADTGDLAAIDRLKPIDATTNPSLITAAAKQPANTPLLLDALAKAAHEGLTGNAKIERAIDLLTVEFGLRILARISGRVSTEVDARLSFDTPATVAKAREIIALYQQRGVDTQRVLIKIAATWQGIEAAKTLEAEGIHCNLTLIFGIHQAVACADAGVTLISPFVGRILDWYKQAESVASYPIEKDPGVLSVKHIYTYFKQCGLNTQVMGASFRSAEQIIALAGCDLLTIAPNFLDELDNMQGKLIAALSPQITDPHLTQLSIDQAAFEQMHGSNPMANDLLQKGIDGFMAARTDLAARLTEVLATA